MSSAISFVARRNGVDATLPFFIPAPTLIGTFGAVIRIKSPIRSRQALFDIGIAGPIAGFLVAVPVLFWGLALSKPMPPTAVDSSLLLGYPPDFQYRLSSRGAAYGASGVAGQPVSASGGSCSLGGNAGDRAEPFARRATGRRPHHLRRRAASSPVGDVGQHCGADTVGHSLSGRAGWSGRSSWDSPACGTRMFPSGRRSTEIARHWRCWRC